MSKREKKYDIIRAKDRLGVMMSVTKEEEDRIKEMSDRECVKYVINYLRHWLQGVNRH